jgi:hypothetical protein
MPQRSLAALILFLCLGQAAVAQQRPQERKWAELASLIEGREVQLTLPDAVTIRGDVVGVRNDTLILNIGRTTNHVMHPKGHASIPRESVTLIELHERHRSGRRHLGAIVGTAVGVGLGIFAAQSGYSAGKAVLTGTAVGSGGALIGYFVGRNMGGSKTLIQIVP